MSTKIEFGTSGWRAIIADQFTFSNVERVTQAIALHLLDQADPPSVLVGYDNRFASDRFARTAARVLAANQIHVLLSSAPVPTPTVSFAVRARKLAGAINITASHNPGE